MAEREGLDWLRFAEDDLAAAKFLLGMPERKLEIICYHCQQCAEKAVKGLYALRDRDIPRTHDFRVLVSGLRAECDLSTLDDAFALLQPFAVLVRYPYETELLPGDEEESIKAAETILANCTIIMKRR